MDIATTAKIHDSVTFGPNCERVQIGHGVRINRDVYIDVKDLTIGDCRALLKQLHNIIR